MLQASPFLALGWLALLVAGPLRKMVAKLRHRRPPCVARPDEVTQSMKDRQREHPERWTMTVQQWIDIVNYCKGTDLYKVIKSTKGHVSMYDINQSFVIPWTKGTGCGVAVLTSRSCQDPTVLEAELMVSHAWAEDVEETLEALEELVERQRIPPSARVWFCLFANYQPGDDQGPTVEQQLAMEPFKKVIQCAGVRNGCGMTAIHTSKADLYDRLWCVYEVFVAIEEQVQIHVAMSQACKEDMTDHIRLCLQTGQAWNFCLVSTMRARCSCSQDTAMLFRQITDAGGFERLDEVVENFRLGSLPLQVRLELFRNGMPLDRIPDGACQDAADMIEPLKSGEVSFAEAMRITSADQHGLLKTAWAERALGADFRQRSTLELTNRHFTGAEEFSAIIEGASREVQLTRLKVDLGSEFGHTASGLDASRALARELARLTQLTTLDLNLQNRRIGSEGCRLFARALTGLTQLTTLKLIIDGDDISSEGYGALASALAGLVHLTTLKLKVGKGTGPEGCMALAWALAGLTQLNRLGFVLTGRISPEGCNALAGALAELTELISLEIVAASAPRALAPLASWSTVAVGEVLATVPVALVAGPVMLAGALVAGAASVGVAAVGAASVSSSRLPSEMTQVLLGVSEGLPRLTTISISV